MAFLDDLRAHIMSGGGGAQGTGMAPIPGMGQAPTGQAPTGPGVTPSGVRMPQPRPFVAPPGAAPQSPVGRPPVGQNPGFAALPPPQAAGTGMPAPGPTAMPPMPPSIPRPTGQPAPSPTVGGGEAASGADGAPALAPPVQDHPMGTTDPANGNITLSPEGKAAYQERMASARAAFGPYPGANDPTVPPPPITPGKLFFNPFTGTYGRA